jgi:hypothetical protein
MIAMQSVLSHELSKDSPRREIRSPTISQKYITIGGYNFNDPKYNLLVNDEMIITMNHESEIPVPAIVP